MDSHDLARAIFFLGTEKRRGEGGRGGGGEGEGGGKQRRGEESLKGHWKERWLDKSPTSVRDLL